MNLNLNLKIVHKVSVSILVHVLIPQHLHAAAYMVKNMVNHLKLPEPVWYHLPAVNADAMADKEKMLPCQQVAERQLVTKC